MPNWNDLLEEIRVEASQTAHDRVRRKYLMELHKHTKRNVIIYYSGWLQRPGLRAQQSVAWGIDDNDKNGFMSCIHKLERKTGLDLILHTPGGDLAAVESLISYLHATFGNDIRCIVPHMAMSGGTMIALASKQIVMGKHSSIGPIDPQIGGIGAFGVLEEFNGAVEAVKKNPASAAVWHPIISKYNPTLIGSCQKAVTWAVQLGHQYLMSNMLAQDKDKEAKAAAIVRELGDHLKTLSHARHIDPAHAKQMGLNILDLESDQKLQDLVLTIHHACCHTFSGGGAVKIIENHNGIAVIDTCVKAG